MGSHSFEVALPFEFAFKLLNAFLFFKLNQGFKTKFNDFTLGFRLREFKGFVHELIVYYNICSHASYQCV